MTTKIANVANLALHAFQQHSLRTAVVSAALNRNATTDSSTPPSTTAHQHTQKKSNKQYHPPSHLSDSLQRLLSSVHSLTPMDIGFDMRWVSDSHIYAAPVAYVHIMENEIFSMGIFILRPGSRIPLHDHPGMYGVIRVMHGSLRYRSFTPLGNIKPGSPGYPKSPFSVFSDSRWQLTDLIVARPHQDIVLTQDSYTQLLSPNEGNFHEVFSVDGPAVFLDILAPPYDHDLGTRECRFYKEVILPNPIFEQSGIHSSAGGSVRQFDDIICNSVITNRESQDICEDSNSPLVYLVETNQPKDYWCESAEYVGPSVL